MMLRYFKTWDLRRPLLRVPGRPTPMAPPPVTWPRLPTLSRPTFRPKWRARPFGSAFLAISAGVKRRACDGPCAVC
eukprot:218563-Lingulodinium_polyedra.AAC.1